MAGRTGAARPSFDRNRLNYRTLDAPRRLASIVLWNGADPQFMSYRQLRLQQPARKRVESASSGALERKLCVRRDHHHDLICVPFAWTPGWRGEFVIAVGSAWRFLLTASSIFARWVLEG